ncbi:MAG: DUF721 domain-containing protein [Acidobacteria bacterium]|jgi:hypothetical protein|nr:MAG: DUF721 domain-containing protein [Acidobacteriota bacterium]GIU81246.1 MAG: hypothetical protein KatS3mg006_0310 [Pyrinomonadaceae bacterium]
MDELFDTLCRMMEEKDADEDFRQAVVFAAWGRAVGDLQKKAVPVRLNQKSILVAVVNEDWKKYLESISSKLVFKINALLKQPLINSIDFYVDSTKVTGLQEPSLPEESAEACFDYVSAEIRNAADCIEDETLRYNFLLAAGACLRRKERLEKK